MPQMGFEPTIPVFERVKTFCAIDHAALHWLFHSILCNIEQQFTLLYPSCNMNCSYHIVAG
jgi:hypothetical protein